jgi:glycosyltransferase involved in cell wall biosynthesis
MTKPSFTLALDATLWDEPTTGIGLYTRELTSALRSLGASPLRLGARVSGESPRGRLGRTPWTLGRLPSELERRQVGLYHAFGNFNLPLVLPPGTRFILTVHDVIPELFPDTVSLAFRWQFKLWLERSLRLAERIVCVSDTTERDLVRLHPAAAGKTAVVHNGVDHVLRVPPLDASSKAYLEALGLQGPFVLFAGAWDRRKNLPGLLAAWRRIPAQERVPLVLVGQPWFGSGVVEREVTELRASGMDLRPLGYQPSSILYALMRRATVLAFPSLYEGFGLPPLEAMRLGTPVLGGNTGALPEVCGPAAVTVDAEDPEAMALALRRLLRTPEERAQRAEEGRRWAEGFTWGRAAEKLMVLYSEVWEV